MFHTKRPFVFAALLISLLLAAVVAPFASKSPDGLEKVAETQGFLKKSAGQPAWRFALLPAYAIPGVRNEKVSTGLAGLIGTGLVFGVGLSMARLCAGRRAAPAPQGKLS